MLTFLGGKCTICGFDDDRALQVDHINGGGCREWDGVSELQRLNMVKTNPQNYQLLCANHNAIKRVERNETTLNLIRVKVV